jgi:hypothetical protein
MTTGFGYRNQVCDGGRDDLGCVAHVLSLAQAATGRDACRPAAGRALPHSPGAPSNPLANERLQRGPDGLVRIALKKPFGDGFAIATACTKTADRPPPAASPVAVLGSGEVGTAPSFEEQANTSKGVAQLRPPSRTGADFSCPLIGALPGWLLKMVRPPSTRDLPSRSPVAQRRPAPTKSTRKLLRGELRRGSPILKS